MLALERACRDLPSSATETATDSATEPGPEIATDPLARGLFRRDARARAALRDVRAALASGDLVAAWSRLAAARDIASPLGDPRLDAWLELFESELAFAAGDVSTAARRSSTAEQAARRAGEPATFLSIYWIRAVRALRRGNGGDGELVSGWMESWLTSVAPRAGLRLRCFGAAFALDDDRPERAIDRAADVVAAVPGTSEAALCGAIVSQAFLALDRVTDAARIATSSIVRCPALPPSIAARLYLDASIALELAGAAAEAARCSDLALRLDPDVAAPPTPADMTSIGLEARLL